MEGLVGQEEQQPFYHPLYLEHGPVVELHGDPGLGEKHAGAVRGGDGQSAAARREREVSGFLQQSDRSSIKVGYQVKFSHCS